VRRPLRLAWALAALLAWPAAATAETHLLVITGVAGSADYAARFQKWAGALIDAATAQGGLPAADVVYLADKPVEGRTTGRSTRETVEKTFADFAARLAPDDELFVVLIGHGSFDSRGASFNLPGPDLTAEDYARLLDGLGTRRVAFVNTASSSGGFLEPLAGPDRTIVTATRTGGERNDTRFPAYFVEAFAGATADTNRDGRISVGEAFEYARTKVVDAYQKEGLILTEHAALADGHDGALAAMTFLLPDREAAAEARAADPELRALIEQRQALEAQVNELKLRKPQMDPAEYERRLEQLLTDLALKTRAIAERQGQK